MMAIRGFLCGGFVIVDCVAKSPNKKRRRPSTGPTRHIQYLIFAVRGCFPLNRPCRNGSDVSSLLLYSLFILSTTPPQPELAQPLVQSPHFNKLGWRRCCRHRASSRLFGRLQLRGNRMRSRANGIHIRGWSFIGLFLGQVHRCANLEAIMGRGYMHNMLHNVQSLVLESSRRLRSSTRWEENRARGSRWCSYS